MGSIMSQLHPFLTIISRLSKTSILKVFLLLVYHVTRNPPVCHHIIVCISYFPTNDMVRSAHHVTRHNTPIHNILSTAPQLSISQKALGMLPEDGNVMPKHVGATIHN